MTSLRAILQAGGHLGQANVRRRDLLKAGAATSLSIALPACGSEQSPGPDTSSSGNDSSGSQVSSTTSTATTSNSSAASSSSHNATTTSTTSTNTSAAASSTTSATSSASHSTNSGLSSSTTTSQGESNESSTSSTTASQTDSETSVETSAESSGGTSTNGQLEVPPWDDVPVCTASPTDGAGQGPFFIHNEEKEDDVDLFRQDISGRYDPDAEPGTDMHLHLRILEAGGSGCADVPVQDIEVYIWHTDGQGFYSGFGNPGDQKPDDPYAGVPGQNDLDNSDRFCRGVGLTDENGVVSFKSIFPGWYNGRDVHIHFVALKKGSASRGRMTYSGGDHLFTTQLYFEKELTDTVHKASEPYLRRTMLSKYQDAITPDENGSSGLRIKANFATGIVVAQMQIMLDSGGA